MVYFKYDNLQGKKEVILLRNIQRTVIPLVRRFVFFFTISLLILSIVLKDIFERHSVPLWLLILVVIPFIIAISVTSLYKQARAEEVIGDFKYLKRDIEESRFKVIEHRNDYFLLKPKFDYPYSLFNGDMVEVRYINETAIIEGPKYYVDTLIKDIRGDANKIIKLLSNISVSLLIIAMGILPLIPDSGIDWTFKRWFHNIKMQVLSTDIIEVEDEEMLGNSIGNINNWGYAVEGEDYIFYVDDYINIVRTDKTFSGKLDLIDNRGQGGLAISQLNVIDDWIFYDKGTSLNRMRIDGTNNQTLYNSGYISDINIKGNWIYFINYEDNYNLYKMDLNGQNLTRLSKDKINNFAIYGDRLYFSHFNFFEPNDEDAYVESMTLDGSERRIELELVADKLSIHKGYFYYLGFDDKLYRNEMNNGKGPEILVDDLVSTYIITDFGIFYSKEHNDDFYDSKGLYKIEFDGSEGSLVLDEGIFGELTYVGDYLLFNSSISQYSPVFKKLNIISGNLEIIK